MAKILLTAIFKDDSEYPFASRMLESYAPYVSGMVIALTGVSQDFKKLKKLLKTYKAHIIICSPETHPKLYLKHNDVYEFAHFAEARNVTFEYADTLEGFDWYTWADVDDVVVGGEDIALVADLALKQSLDMVFFTYWYSIKVKEDGTFNQKDVVIEHLRERLIKPKRCKWISRLHEVCVPKDGNYKPLNSEYRFDPKIKQFTAWAHLSNDERSQQALERNLRILELQAQEEERKDPRTLFYLAKTYKDVGKPGMRDLSEQLLLEYLEMSGWREERGNAYQLLGDISSERGQHEQALDWYYKAMHQAPYHHMTLLALSREYAELGLFEESDAILEIVLKMDTPKARTTISNPLEVQYFASSLKYNQCIRKNDIKGALDWLRIRNKLGNITNDKMVTVLEESLALNDQAKSFFSYAKWLKDKGYTEQIKHLLEAVAPDFQNEAFIQVIANQVQEPRTWKSNEIAYFASWGGPGIAEWTPENLKEGLGGSETAVIHLSEQWAKLGYTVTVYTDVGEKGGEYNGVTYKHWSTFNWNDMFNILILWRSPHLLDRDIHAHKLYMDLHDVVSQVEWTPERMNKVNKVFFKSQYHRSMLPKLPDEKAEVISNGIEL